MREARMLSRLLRSAPLDVALPQALAQLGSILGASATALYLAPENGLGVSLVARATWLAAPASLGDELVTYVHLSDDLLGAHEQMLNSMDASTLTVDAAAQGARRALGLRSGSLALAPIQPGSEWRGLLVAVDARPARIWERADLDLLAMAGELVSTALAYEADGGAAQRADERLAGLPSALPDTVLRLQRSGLVRDLKVGRDDRLFTPWQDGDRTIYQIGPHSFAEQVMQAAAEARASGAMQQFEYSLPQRLGDVLLAEGLISQEALFEALCAQQAHAEQDRHILLGDLLLSMGRLSPALLEEVLRLQRTRLAVSDYEVRVFASGDEESTCVIRDITPRKRASQQEHLQLRRAELRAELTQALARVGLDYEQMLGVVAGRVADAFGGVCVIHMPAPGADRLEPVAWHCSEAAGLAALGGALRTWRPPSGEGLIGAVLQGGEPVLAACVDLPELPGLTRNPAGEAGQAPALASLMVVSLPVRGAVIGTLTVARAAPALTFQAHDLRFLQELAIHAALAIGDAHRFRATQQLGEDIKRSRDLLRTLFDSLDDGMLLLDRSGRVLASNQALAEMLGCSVGELMAMSWAMICQRIGLDTGEQWLALALYDDQVSQNRVRIERAGSSTTVADMRLIPLTGSHRQLEQCIVQVVDVTERIQLELQLVESERFAASGRLAATVAHEINTPLQSVQAFLYLLNGSPPQQRQSYVDLAQQEIDRIARILKQLLDLYRSGATVTTMLDLNSVIERVLLLIDHTVAQQRVIVSCDFDPALPPLWGRADQLTQMLVHLLVNGVQASPQGGHVVVRTCIGTAQARGLRQIGVAPEQPVAVIEVSDSGPGISAEQQKRIFEPFFSARAGGAGIGLAICAQVVAEHRGAISVHSDNSQGSCFRVVLPIFTDSVLQATGGKLA
jgi:PAS domain S-box-containing protein